MVYIDRVRFGIYSTSAVSGDWLKMLLKRDEGMYTVYTVYYEARSLQIDFSVIYTLGTFHVERVRLYPSH